MNHPCYPYRAFSASGSGEEGRRGAERERPESFLEFIKTQLPSTLSLLTKMPRKCCQRAGFLSAAHEPEPAQLRSSFENSKQHETLIFPVQNLGFESRGPFHGCGSLNNFSGVWCRTAVEDAHLHGI